MLAYILKHLTRFNALKNTAFKVKFKTFSYSQQNLLRGSESIDTRGVCFIPCATPTRDK